MLLKAARHKVGQMLTKQPLILLPQFLTEKSVGARAKGLVLSDRAGRVARGETSRVLPADKATDDKEDNCKDTSRDVSKDTSKDTSKGETTPLKGGDYSLYPQLIWTICCTQTCY